jgi:hypothetical protein
LCREGADAQADGFEEIAPGRGQRASGGVAGTGRLLTIRGGVQGVRVARLNGSGQAGKIIAGKIMEANEPCYG